MARDEEFTQQYLDFELEVGSGEGREYPLSLLHSPAGEAAARMAFPFDELALERHLDKLQIALLRSGGKRRRYLTTEERDVQAFGSALFEALLVGEVRSRYDVSLERAENQGKGLRIKLRFSAPELAALPWEYLYDPRQGEYLCLSASTPLVRYLALPRTVRPLGVKPPLRILGMIASPEGFPRLDMESERTRVERALADLKRQGLVEVHWVEGGTWRNLQRTLRKGPWHIFHFVGHGRYDTQREEGQLALVGDSGRFYPLGATRLARLLCDQRSLRLALLNACEGARGGAEDVFSSAAASLVRRGLPAVLAMQYEITDRAAIELSQAFYEALAEGLPVDAAVAEARKAVSLAVANTLEWGTPVLYMRAEDGRIFSFQRAADRDQVEAPRPGKESAVVEVESLARALENARRVLRELEAQAAIYTTSTIPAQLKIDLEEKRAEVDKLEALSSQMLAPEDRDQRAAVSGRASARRPAERPKEADGASLAERLEKDYFAGLGAVMLKRWETARGHFQAVVGLDPGYRDAADQLRAAEGQIELAALYERARQLQKKGDWRGVRGVFEKIHAIQADYPDRDGLLAAAEGELEKTDLYHKSLEAMGRREWAQAVEDLERLVKIDPAYPQAKDLLERARAEQRATIGPAKKQNEIELELAPGVTLALVRVPAGSFTMGSSDEDGMAYGDEKPQHTVELSEYWIGRYPVTVAQFAAFVKASGHKTTAEEQGEGYVWPPGEYVKGANWQHPHGPDSDVKGKDDHPVTQVSWSDAAAFCQWVSQVTGHEMRLPSEAEWEKAARGTDGRLYPWGNEKPDEVRCNFNQNVKDTTAVGKYSPQGDSPYGCAEMAGNVWEWCHDWFDEKEYARRVKGTVEDPPGPASGSSRVVRGGAWDDDGGFVRCAYRLRGVPDDGFDFIGFRPARSP